MPIFRAYYEVPPYRILPVWWFPGAFCSCFSATMCPGPECTSDPQCRIFVSSEVRKTVTFAYLSIQIGAEIIVRRVTWLL